MPITTIHTDGPTVVVRGPCLTIFCYLLQLRIGQILSEVRSIHKEQSSLLTEELIELWKTNCWEENSDICVLLLESNQSLIIPEFRRPPSCVPKVSNLECNASFGENVSTEARCRRVPVIWNHMLPRWPVRGIFGGTWFSGEQSDFFR